MSHVEGPVRRCGRRAVHDGRHLVARGVFLGASVALLLLNAAHALAEPATGVGLTAMAGLRAGSGFESAAGGNEELRLRSGAAGSLAVEWPVDARRLGQVLVSHQRTRLAIGPAATTSAAAAAMPLSLTHLHVGGVNYFEGPGTGPGPYVIGGLGITQLAPNLPGTRSRTRASLNVGFGHEWALARPAAGALALRLELRAYLVAIGSEGAFFCSGGCTVTIRADTLTQAEAAIGLRLSF